MQNHINELRKLARFYCSLENDISEALQISKTNPGDSIQDKILQDRSRIAQIERMNAHILQLSEDLKNSRHTADRKARQEQEDLAREAKSHVVRLQELCAQAYEMIEKNKCAIKEELQGIKKGRQYLKSVDPVRNNYPKFIDSTG